MRYLIIILASWMLVGCVTETLYQPKFFAYAKFSDGASIAGFSNISMEDAKTNATNECKRIKEKTPRFLVFGEIYDCPITSTFLNPKHPENQEELKKIAEQKKKEAQQAAIKSEQRKLENEYGRYISQCEYIGFKKNTDKMGECVLKLYQTEASIAALNSQKRAADSADTLTNLVILNESLKLMNPPRQNFNCQARPFGIYTNVYCN